MGHKYFISYSRSVKEDVNRMVELLRAKGHDVWWDADISPAQPWWATIVDKIIWCDVFVFVVSEKSVSSPYCLAELKYATERNRPILPFIIDDQTRYTIPSEVTPKLNQWLTYNGDADDTTQQIILAVARLDRSRYQDIDAQRPSEPGKNHQTLIEQYQQAVTLADEGHFEEALKNFREIEALDAKTWGPDCHQWIAKINLYRQVAELAAHKATLKQARANWNTYTDRYTDEEGGVFDPLEVSKKLSSVEDKKIALGATEPSVPEVPKTTPVEAPGISPIAATTLDNRVSPINSPDESSINAPDTFPGFLQKLELDYRYILSISVPMIIVGGIFGRPTTQEVGAYNSTLNFIMSVSTILVATSVNIAVNLVLRMATKQPRPSTTSLAIPFIGSSFFISIATQALLPILIIQIFNLWSIAPNVDFVISCVINGLVAGVILNTVAIGPVFYVRSPIVRGTILTLGVIVVLVFIAMEWTEFLYPFAPIASSWFYRATAVIMISLIFTVSLGGRFFQKSLPRALSSDAKETLLQ